MLKAVKRRCRLRLSRWRFDKLPPQRRVRLDLHTDGRQLSFLMAAIHGAGYGVQLAGAPMLFRELLAISGYSAIPARVDGADLDCAIALLDRPGGSTSTATRIVRLDYDVFSPGRAGRRMPYVMHPSVYYNRAHLSPASFDQQQTRPIRVGFYGTHDPYFYTRDYGFPGLNRSQILDSFIQTYGQSFVEAPCRGSQAFAVSMDFRGGDEPGLGGMRCKQFLTQSTYLKVLRQTNFALCLPGWCMPLAHSLIESLYCGAIPITNAGHYMDPPLRHGVEALTFTTMSEFHQVVQQAQSMADEEILGMRAAAIRYYHNHLEPAGWWRQLMASSASRLLVNAEELSVPLMTAV